LSSPQRLQIFLRLTACCRPAVSCDADPEAIRCCVGELGAGLGLSASTGSHHLKELREAGLMQVERHGQKIECRISEETVSLLAAFFGEESAVCCDAGSGKRGGQNDAVGRTRAAVGRVLPRAVRSGERQQRSRGKL
jgi:ArsR family transcriptional regulator